MNTVTPTKPYGKLTDNQKAILQFIAQYVSNAGIPPTLREIAKGTGQAATRVYHSITLLSAYGFLQYTEGTKRGLRLLIDPNAKPEIEIEHTPLFGGTELECPNSKVIVIVRNDGLLSVDGPFKLTTLDELEVFKAQMRHAESLMRARLG